MTLPAVEGWPETFSTKPILGGHAMKKLTLNLDELSVETFATAEAGEQGVVAGYGPVTAGRCFTVNVTGCVTKDITCGGTCLREWTCSPDCIYD